MGPASWVGNRMCDIYQRELGVVEVRASRWAAISRREGGLEHKVAGLSLSSPNLSAVDLQARAHEPLIVGAAGGRLCRRQGNLVMRTTLGSPRAHTARFMWMVRGVIVVSEESNYGYLGGDMEVMPSGIRAVPGYHREEGRMRCERARILPLDLWLCLCNAR